MVPPLNSLHGYLLTTKQQTVYTCICLHRYMYIQCVVCSCLIYVYMMSVCVPVLCVGLCSTRTAGTPRCNWPLTLKLE